METLKEPQQELKKVGEEKCSAKNLIKSRLFSVKYPPAIINKAWAEWETSTKQGKRYLQIPEVFCAVKTECKQLSQASQIINTTPAAISKSSNQSITHN